MPIAESAIPKYFVDVNGRATANAAYPGEEVFFVEEMGPSREAASAVSEGTATTAAGTSAQEQPAGGHVARYTFRPNCISVDLTVPKPGILVVNQNYHPAWRTDRGELFDRDGLIALRLRETGSYTVHLRYRPRSFVAGLAISVLSLAGWVVACWMFGPSGGRTAQIAARRAGCLPPR